MNIIKTVMRDGIATSWSIFTRRESSKDSFYFDYGRKLFCVITRDADGQRHAVCIPVRTYLKMWDSLTIGKLVEVLGLDDARKLHNDMRKFLSQISEETSDKEEN